MISPDVTKWTHACGVAHHVSHVGLILCTLKEVRPGTLCVDGHILARVM